MLKSRVKTSQCPFINKTCDHFPFLTLKFVVFSLSSIDDSHTSSTPPSLPGSFDLFNFYPKPLVLVALSLESYLFIFLMYTTNHINKTIINSIKRRDLSVHIFDSFVRYPKTCRLRCLFQFFRSSIVNLLIDFKRGNRKIVWRMGLNGRKNCKTIHLYKSKVSEWVGH